MTTPYWQLTEWAPVSRALAQILGAPLAVGESLHDRAALCAALVELDRSATSIRELSSRLQAQLRDICAAETSDHRLVVMAALEGARDQVLRIATWNVAGNWDGRHESTLAALAPDIVLLTEIDNDLAVPGFVIHRTTTPMTSRKTYSAVLTRSALEPLPDPHPASAAASVRNLDVVSSILPWPLATTSQWPWGSADQDERMAETVATLEPALRDREVIWGGDWNQPLEGNNSGFRNRSRALLVEAVDRLGLQVPTQSLPGNKGQCTIDHIAVPKTWIVTAQRAQHEPKLSDHEHLYAIECVRPVASES